MLPSHPIIAQLSAANSSQDNTRLRPPPPYEEAASSSRQGSVERGLSAERTLVQVKDGINRVPANTKQVTIPEINREPVQSKVQESRSQTIVDRGTIQVPVISSEGQTTSGLSQRTRRVDAGHMIYPNLVKASVSDVNAAMAHQEQMPKRTKKESSQLPKLVPKPEPAPATVTLEIQTLGGSTESGSDGHVTGSEGQLTGNTGGHVTPTFPQAPELVQQLLEISQSAGEGQVTSLTLTQSLAEEIIAQLTEYTNTSTDAPTLNISYRQAGEATDNSQDVSYRATHSDGASSVHHVTVDKNPDQDRLDGPHPSGPLTANSSVMLNESESPHAETLLLNQLYSNSSSPHGGASPGHSPGQQYVSPLAIVHQSEDCFSSSDAQRPHFDVIDLSNHSDARSVESSDLTRPADPSELSRKEPGNTSRTVSPSYLSPELLQLLTQSDTSAKS